MQQILVIGGSGHLGRLVAALERGRLSRARDESAGQPWRGLAGPEWKQADLKTGAGMAEAVAGMETAHAMRNEMTQGSERL